MYKGFMEIYEAVKTEKTSDIIRKNNISEKIQTELLDISNIKETYFEDT